MYIKITKRSNINLNITAIIPSVDKSIIPAIVLTFHNNNRPTESIVKLIKERASNGNIRNRQLTIKSVGLCKYMSSGIKNKTVKLSANENDKTAAIFSFGGSFFNNSTTTQTHFIN